MKIHFTLTVDSPDLLAAIERLISAITKSSREDALPASDMPAIVDVLLPAGSTRPPPAAPDVTNPGAAAFPMKLVVTVPATPKTKTPFTMFPTSKQGPRA